MIVLIAALFVFVSSYVWLIYYVWKYKNVPLASPSITNPIVSTFIQTMDRSNHCPYVIGICGGSGSGKTYISNTITQALKHITNDQCTVTVVSQDSYYKGGDMYSNYDIPQAIDFPLMIAHIKDLMNNKEIYCPVYDFTTHRRTKAVRKLLPAKIIIIEGILIFTVETLRNLLQMKIFIEADEPTQIFRRIIRDVQERGRTLDQIQNRYEKDVWPAYKSYVLPSSRHADIIVNNFNNCFVGPQIILSHLIRLIEKMC